MKLVYIIILLLIYKTSFRQSSIHKQQPLLYLKVSPIVLVGKLKNVLKRLQKQKNAHLLLQKKSLKVTIKKIAGVVGNDFEGDTFANFSANNTLLWAISISYKTTKTNPTQPILIIKYKLVPLPPKVDVVIQEVEISPTTIYKNGFVNFIEQ